MNFRQILHLALLVGLGFTLSAFAVERGTPAEAKAMVEHAVAHVKEVGNEKAFADFTSAGGEWHKKDLYVFVVQFDGLTLAHGANKGFLGKNLIEVKDMGGKFFIKEMIDVAKAKGSGSVDYYFTDPETKKVAQKTSYVARVPGYDGMIGVGVYKQ